MDTERTKICIRSLGCTKNLVDSEVMLGCLREGGYETTTEESEADIIVVNTCGFINDAKEESIEEILRLAQFKSSGRCRALVVAGCLAQRYREELARELPEVDCFIGTGEYHRIAEIIRDGFYKRVNVGTPRFVADHTTPRVLSTPGHYAYIKVAEGCSNLCTYCTIPSIRGVFRSRSEDSIVKEAETLSAAGVKEINLVAQDTTSYGVDRGGVRLAGLLRRLSRIEGIEWIRPLYLYPSRITDELLDVMSCEAKILKYFDVPVQHASAHILKAMNRHYTRSDIERLAERLRKRFSNVTLRTSLIVGFPGESDADFEELVDFVRTVRFDRLGVFRYSREEGTPAYDMRGQIPEKVKQERWNVLMEVQRDISFEKNRSLVGTKVELLVEGRSAEDGRFYGRTPAQAPEVDGVTYIEGRGVRAGEIVEAVIKDADDYDLVAESVGAGLFKS